MTACNATLTTATVHACPDDPFACGSMDTISNCHVDGEPTVHVELHTLTCDGGSTCFTDLRFGRNWHESGGTGTWFDDTPGATPHKPVSTVTDAEVEAAIRAWEETQDNYDSPHADIRRALEAFLAFRAAQETCPNPHCEDGFVSSADWEAPCRLCSKQGD